MAPHAEDEVLEGRLSRSAIDTFPVRVAILDDEGSILSSNRAWQEFAEANDIPMCPDVVGVNYPEVVDASDNAHATRAATGLRSVLRGERDRFELEYSWHLGGEKRWFLMRAVPFTQGGDRYMTVTQIEITNR
jgi:PAS domain-containing protein